MSDTSKVPGKKSNVPGDGYCFYNAVLRSLACHPSGNLLNKLYPNNQYGEFINDILNYHTYAECWGTIYDAYCKSLPFSYLLFEVGSEQREGWILKLLKPNNCITQKDDFLKAVRSKKRFPKLEDPTTWAGQCEVDACKAFLEERLNVNLKVLNPESENQIDLGTVDNPIVHVMYNGSTHYDAYISKAIRRDEQHAIYLGLGPRSQGGKNRYTSRKRNLLKNKRLSKKI
jgi:hypothetical protein